MSGWVLVIERFWVKLARMIHKASLKRKEKFEAIMEIDDKN